MPTVGALFLLAFFASAGREVTKDIEDVDSDRGARETLPMQVGAPMSAGVAALFIGIAVALSPTPYWPLATMGWAYLGVVLVADMAFIYSLVILRTSPASAQRAQKAGMVLALLAFLAGSIAGGVA
jgi:4-hydroxybenzoate polyprenyltransferase